MLRLYRYQISSGIMSKIKKYQLNRNVGFYNFDTGLYETRDGRNLTYEESLRNKWKCDKCFETFQILEI